MSWSFSPLPGIIIRLQEREGVERGTPWAGDSNLCKLDEQRGFNCFNILHQIFPFPQALDTPPWLCFTADEKCSFTHVTPKRQELRYYRPQNLWPSYKPLDSWRSPSRFGFHCGLLCRGLCVYVWGLIMVSPGQSHGSQRSLAFCTHWPSSPFTGGSGGRHLNHDFLCFSDQWQTATGKMDGAKVTGLGHTLIMRAVPIGIQQARCSSKSSEQSLGSGDI